MGIVFLLFFLVHTSVTSSKATFQCLSKATTKPSLNPRTEFLFLFQTWNKVHYVKNEFLMQLLLCPRPGEHASFILTSDILRLESTYYLFFKVLIIYYSSSWKEFHFHWLNVLSCFRVVCCGLWVLLHWLSGLLSLLHCYKERSQLLE